MLCLTAGGTGFTLKIYRLCGYALTSRPLWAATLAPATPRLYKSRGSSLFCWLIWAPTASSSSPFHLKKPLPPALPSAQPLKALTCLSGVQPKRALWWILRCPPWPWNPSGIVPQSLALINVPQLKAVLIQVVLIKAGLGKTVQVNTVLIQVRKMNFSKGKRPRPLLLALWKHSETS